MSFHLLVRSSGPLRAQDGSPPQRPGQKSPGPQMTPFSRWDDRSVPLKSAEFGQPQWSEESKIEAPVKAPSDVVGGVGIIPKFLAGNCSRTWDSGITRS
jgi:hypothetical protein